jgi:hypothetical protein
MATPQFPTDPMMGPSSPYGQVSPKTSMFANPGGSGFEQFINAVQQGLGVVGEKAGKGYQKLGGTKALAGRYMPLLAGGLALAANPTNIGGAAGTGLGGVAGATLGAPLGPVGMLAGSALGSAIGGGLGSAAQNLLVGGAQAAGRAITGQQREAGISPGIVPGTGTGVGFSDADVKRLAELSRLTGQSQVDIARQMFPVSEQYRAAEAQRQMQLNQQTAQLTGALNRQLYMAQLAGGAQAQAGETTRTMMTAPNPYAASAFQYRG